ncbi:hypothetical protein ACJX0J_013604, partial [Zea mays]
SLLASFAYIYIILHDESHHHFDPQCYYFYVFSFTRDDQVNIVNNMYFIIYSIT